MPSTRSSAGRLAKLAGQLSPETVPTVETCAAAAAAEEGAAHDASGGSAALPLLTDHTAAPTAMTDEMRFFFDLKGWILLPAVLSPSEIERYTAAVYEQAATLTPTSGQQANNIVGNGYTVGAPCRRCPAAPVSFAGTLTD